MTPFALLSSRGQVRRLARLARDVLPVYGIAGANVRLLVHGYNTTFRVDAVALPALAGRRTGAAGELSSPPGNGRYVLRLHRSDAKSVDEIRSELLWLQALRRDTGLVVPDVVPARDGRLVLECGGDEVAGPRRCVLLRWVEGRFVRVNGEHMAAAVARQIGVLMARLHQHALRFSPPPGFIRPRLDVAGILAPLRPVYDAWQCGHLDAFSLREVAIMRAAEARLRAELAAAEAAAEDVLLIHADLHPANVLFHASEARPIDFDDCGFGHPVYDLAVPLPDLAEHAPLEVVQDALLAGYRSVRPFPGERLRLLPAFLHARYLHLIPFYLEVSRNPAFSAWAQRALRVALDRLERYTG